MTVVRWPDESPEYAKRRDALHEAEVALRDQRERVAELRRQLPADTVIPDEMLCEVRDGVALELPMSALFTRPELPLIVMHFMYGKAQTSPCPMCTCWADGYDGLVPHIEQRANFVVLVAGDPGAFGEYARERGWRNLRIVSSGQSEFKRKLGFEDEAGGQMPGVSVLLRGADGTLRHSYSACAHLGQAGVRGMDLLNPLWHYFDLLPEGRGDFMPKKTYGPEAR
jgi:predicted dithiol-disulfide oxidoreductase (DUF899 family)